MLFFWVIVFLFFKQKTAYEMRISDWSSDVCSSDLAARAGARAVSRALEGTAAVSPGWYAVWASEGASDATRYAAEAVGHATQAKGPDGGAARDTSFITQPKGADALAALNAAKARQVAHFLSAVGTNR